MADTPVSLLDRLRDRPDPQSWDRLIQVYEPFLRRFLRDPALQSDADDLLQDILTVLVRELPKFRRQRTGSFRAWLRTVAVNRVNAWWRQKAGRPAAAGGTDAAVRLAELADPASGLSRQWDAEHDRHVARRLLELLEPEFTPGTWAAFRRQVVDGLPASAAAAELGISVNAALLAKSRVLRRLRDEAAGLID
ncbi:MAG TPA: sigma-70 family RNA polymerase sigma factor [Gemmataceae bacterium]|jgi:RNA polymerase sigma-70 factor (ECF subfamily)